MWFFIPEAGARETERRANTYRTEVSGSFARQLHGLVPCDRNRSTPRRHRNQDQTGYDG